MRAGRRGLLARLAGGLLLVGLAAGAFVATRPEEDPPPTTTTTTTFPEAAYVEAMSVALRSRVPVDEPGARCIAQALLGVLGAEALHELTDDPDPLAALTPLQREQALRSVVTCLDPALAATILGGGSPVTQAPITLPVEEG